jgi:putative ABC transport system ATP-binding protein
VEYRFSKPEARVSAILEPLVEARELYRFFQSAEEETFALRGVSLFVSSGEMVALMGPSGSGKSTLLSCIAGLDEPDGGQVLLAGQRITRRPEAERASLRARWLGVLMQSGNLLDHLSVQRNIEFAGKLGRTKRERPLPGDILAQVGLGAKSSARPSTLSGGEAARAGLAVALAAKPPILLADEPTAEVDPENESVLMELLRAHADGGGAVLVATHSERVSAVADRTVHLRDGRIER